MIRSGSKLVLHDSVSRPGPPMEKTVAIGLYNAVPCRVVLATAAYQGTELATIISSPHHYEYGLSLNLLRSKVSRFVAKLKKPPTYHDCFLMSTRFSVTKHEKFRTIERCTNIVITNFYEHH